MSFPPTHQLALQGCLTLTVPADVDTEVRLRTLEEDIKSSRKIVDGVPKTENRPEILGLEAKVAAGDVSKKGRLEKMLNTIANFQQEQEIIRRFDTTAGSVVASSGYRTVQDD